jgi:hypothetical protein
MGGNMKVGKLAAIAGAATMAVTAFGATAASASTGPAAVTGSSAGPTYVNMHSGRGSQSAYIEPSRFILLGGKPSITAGTEWVSWFKRSAVGFGPMWGVRNGHRTFVGQVVLRFSDRKSNAQFTATGQQYTKEFESSSTLIL